MPGVFLYQNKLRTAIFWGDKDTFLTRAGRRFSIEKELWGHKSIDADITVNSVTDDVDAKRSTGMQLGYAYLMPA